MRSLSISSKSPCFRTPNSQRSQLFCSQSNPISSSPIPTHTHIAHLILEQKSAPQALQTFKWASQLPHFTHNQSTYRALIHKLCGFRHFDIVHNLLDEMPSSIGSPPGEDIFVTVVQGLGRARRIREVISVLDLMQKFGVEASLKLYNSILDVLVKEDIDIARGFFRKKMMDCGVEGDDYTFGILMKGFCLTNRIGDGFKLLQVMKTKGRKPNTVIYNTLLNALCKNGKVGRARSLMSEMEEPNGITYNLMISAYCKEENLVQALVVMEKGYSSGFVPDVITVTKVIELLCNVGRVSEAAEVLERMEASGGRIDVVAYNTLLKGFCRIGKAKVGVHFMKEMENKGCLPNVETYNALIFGFCEIGMIDSAFDLFNQMKNDGIMWNFDTYDLLVRGFCGGGRVEDGFRILELMEESKGGAGGHVSPYNSIIYGLYRKGRCEEALEFLNKMGKMFPRAVDRSLRILCLCEEGSVENAKKVYDQMIQKGGIPSALVYSSLIKGFCEQKHVREAFELMNEMVGRGYFPVTSTCNALISAFCGQGKIKSALKLVGDMAGRGCLLDSETYSPMIGTLCEKGDFERALRVLLEMVEKGIAPCYHSWNSLLLCLSEQTTWLECKNILLVNNQIQWIIKT